MTSLEESAPKTKKAYYKCCVIDCQNDTNNSPNLQFYKFPTSNVLFPHKLLRRKNWLNSVRLQNSDGSAWEPGKRSRLCSEHFIGDKKSDDPRSPSYNPTIFPQVYKRRTSNARLALNSCRKLLNSSHMECSQSLAFLDFLCIKINCVTDRLKSCPHYYVHLPRQHRSADPVKPHNLHIVS